MKAMVLSALGKQLALVERPDPQAGPGEIVVRVEACGVCRTDLHIVDGELPNIHLPIVPGHEIVGIVERVGPGVSTSRVGNASVFRGSATPAESVPIAPRIAKTCATDPSSRATAGTAASRVMSWPMPPMPFPWPPLPTRWPPHRCSAPA
jgi:NADPH:quinone reductase-like Zn-dependent oxidoreductase